MRKKNDGFQVPLTGGSSLLVIFAVLCLVVFALLGLSTAQADARLADAALDASEAWYAANLEAETVLARLRSGETVAGVQRDGNLYSYICTISDTQQLEVAVELSGGDYTVLRWQAASNADWTPQEGLGVWTGE